MGTWYYQIHEFHRTDALDVAHTYCQIIEVYSSGPRTDGTTPMGETPEELIEDPQRMMKDSKKYPVLPHKEEE